MLGFEPFMEIQKLKKYTSRLAKYYADNRIMHGCRWQRNIGRFWYGCAVSFTLEEYDPSAYAYELGIPPVLAGIDTVVKLLLPIDRCSVFARQRGKMRRFWHIGLRFRAIS